MSYKITILLLLALLTIKDICSAQDITPKYQEALSVIISQNKKLKSMKKKFRVSKTLVSFKTLSWPFLNELSGEQENFDVEDVDFIEVRLTKLSKKEKSKTIIFFSPITNGVIVAEVIKATHDSDDYRSATMFGKGTVFLFRFTNDGRIQSFLMKEIHHN